MLTFKQYLIEKTEKEEDNKYGGMNVPLDLADFPEDENVSLNAFTPSPTSPFAPLKYTRSDRDAYYEALKNRNEQILQNNKKYKLSQPTIDTPYEDAVLRARKEVERMVMDPNNKRDPNFEEKQKLNVNPIGAPTMTDMSPPELGGTGWMDVLRPDNPNDFIKPVNNTIDNSIKNWIDNTTMDIMTYIDTTFNPKSTYKQVIYDPMLDAQHETGLKQERNRRLGVTPSVTNPLETGNYFDSPEYFDRINAIAQRIYDDGGGRNSWGQKRNDKLSPFDIISLQFGKDKTKERNEFLEKQKEYFTRIGGTDQWNESGQAKLARKYADLKDPSYDEQILYKPIEVNTVGDDDKKPLEWLGQTSLKNPEFYASVVDDATKRMLDPNDPSKITQKEAGLPPLTVQQTAQRAIDNEVRLTPSAFESKIKLNKGQIKNWEDFIRVLSHEGQHAEVVPEIVRTDLEKEANSNLGKESEYKSPATIKYGIQPSISGITLGSGYEELEKRGILDSWKLDKQQKIEVKNKLDNADAPSPSRMSKTPDSYLWNRTEMPAFMKELKIDLLRKTGKYPTSDETDVDIEQDRDKLYDIIRERGYNPTDDSDLMLLKSLEFMKTPEGKAIWRGVQKTSPKKDNRYA
jgi:hypothetical protein